MTRAVAMASSDGLQYRALYEYQKEREEDLALCPGDVLTVSRAGLLSSPDYKDGDERSPQGWLHGLNERTKERGNFPGTYVEYLGPARIVPSAAKARPRPLPPPPAGTPAPWGECWGSGKVGANGWGVPWKMARVMQSPGGCLRLVWLAGDAPSGRRSSPRRRSCPGNYLPWCIEGAAGGGVWGITSPLPPPQGKQAAGVAPHQHPGLAAVPAWDAKGFGVRESAGEGAGALWPSREEQKAPWWSAGTFFPAALLPTTAAPNSGCSQCPGECWPPASSQHRCHFLQAGTGDDLGRWWGWSPWDSSIARGCSTGLGGDRHLAGPLQAWGPPAISLLGSAQLVQPALSSPLTVAQCSGAGRDFAAVA